MEPKPVPPTDNVSPAAQLILKSLGFLEDFPLQDRVEGLREGVFAGVLGITRCADILDVDIWLQWCLRSAVSAGTS